MHCSGRCNAARFDARLAVSLDELKETASAEIKKLLADHPEKAPAVERDAYAVPK